MASKTDAPPLPLPTSTISAPTSTSSSSSLPRPLAHVVLLLIDGVGDVPCKAFAAQRQQGEGGSDKNSSSSRSSSSSSSSKRSLTPLQAAAPLEALDAVASRGFLGLLDPVQPGKACGSDTAHLSLLGYDPRTYYRGRGAFESLGAGLSMEPGDIAFKCNFATLEEETGDEQNGGEGGNLAPTPLVASRRADRAFEEAGPVLCSALDGLELPGFPGVEVRVRYATEHRAGVVLSTKKTKTKTAATKAAGALEVSTSTSAVESGAGSGNGAGEHPFELSDAVSGTDPLKDNLPLRRCVSLLSKDGDDDDDDDDEEEEERGGEERRGSSSEQQEEQQETLRRNARTTAEIVNELSDQIRKTLRAHPLNLERRRQGKPVANALLLRGCGARAPLPDFAQRFGFAGARAVAPTKIIAGLALCAGFEVLGCEGGTGDYRTSLRAKVDAVVGAVKGANDEERRRRRRAEEEEGAAAGGGGAQAHAEARPPSPPSSPIFVLLHVKAVDDAGHDRAPYKKMAWLRAVDAALSRLARRLALDDVVVAVTGDHSTPVEFGDHSCEPVPFAAAPLLAVAASAAKAKKEKRKKKREAEKGGGGGGSESESESESEDEGEIVAPSEDEMRRVVSELAATGEKEEYGPFPPSLSSPSAPRFDETSASRGSLGRFPGAEVMPLLVRLSAAWGGRGGEK